MESMMASDAMAVIQESLAANCFIVLSAGCFLDPAELWLEGALMQVVSPAIDRLLRCNYCNNPPHHAQLVNCEIQRNKAISIRKPVFRICLRRLSCEDCVKTG